MGNSLNMKEEDLKSKNISNIINRFLHSSDLNNNIVNNFKSNYKGFKKNSANLKDKNILYTSLSLANDIINLNLHKDICLNNHMYNPIVIFKGIDKIDNTTNEKYEEEIDENEELSHPCQIKTTELLIFKSSLFEYKLNAKISKLFEEFKFSNLNSSNNNFEIYVKPGKKKLQIENKLKTQKSISPKKEKNFKIPEKLALKFEDISLQEYLKLESERLRNDQNFINYKNLRESQEAHDIKVAKQEEKINSDHFNLTIKNLLVQKELSNSLKNSSKLDFFKNKHTTNSNKKEGPVKIANIKLKTPTVEKSEKININKQKILFSPPINNKLNTNKKNFITIGNSSMRTKSKSKASLLNSESYRASPAIMSPSNTSMNIFNTNSYTTKSTSRLTPNNNNNNINTLNINNSRNQIKNENVFRIDLRKNSSNNRYNPNKLILKSPEFEIESFLRSSKSAAQNIKKPVASIKIDIRDLLKDESHLKTQEIEELVTENNKSLSDIFNKT